MRLEIRSVLVLLSVFLALNAGANNSNQCSSENEEESTCTSGSCRYNCQTQCNKTQDVQFQVAGKAFRMKFNTTAADGESIGFPCEDYDSSYRGEVECKCFKGTIVCDSTKCQPICLTGPWKEVGVCSVTCGVGTIEHRREVLQRPGIGQKSCGELSKRVACWMPSCPIDCMVGEWKDDASFPCSKTCGEGVKIQERDVIVPAKFGGTPCPKLKREVPCCIGGEGGMCSEAGCTVGPWEESEPCNSTCGRGFRKETRKVIKASPTTVCTEETERTVSCIGKCPKVDCVEGDWYKVGSCSVTCGQGAQRWARDIITEPENGGRVCGSQEKTEPCQERECPQVQCGRVHANTECQGRPSRGIYIGTQAGPAHCRAMDSDGEEQDVAIMIRNCSSHCSEVPDCEAFNWNPTKKTCCFLNDISGEYKDKQKISCHEMLEALDDEEPASCRRPYHSRYREPYQPSQTKKRKIEEDDDVSFIPVIIILGLIALSIWLICKPSNFLDEDDYGSIISRPSMSASPAQDDGSLYGPASPDRHDYANASGPY